MKNISIDLGTTNTRICMQGKGIVLDEPSIIVINSENNTVYEIGKDAKEMLGRTPANMTAIKPLKGGVIANFGATQLMLKHFVRKVIGRVVISRPNILVSIPSGATEIERRAVEEASIEAGAHDVVLIEEAMAAAIGAGLDVSEPSGCMVVDIGGGTIEIAVISLNSIVTSVLIKKAGDEMDNAIVNYLKKESDILIGERTAETIKIELGSALPYDGEKDEKRIYKGRSLESGLPQETTVSAYQVREAISEILYEIVDAIKQTLEKAPPEIVADVMERGIVLTGGGAKVRGLAEFIENESGMSCTVAQNPEQCVAIGTKKVLENSKYIRLLRKMNRGK